jgi:hypothetical protein
MGESTNFKGRLDSISEAIAINEKLCQNSPEAVRDFYRNQVKYLTEQYRAVLEQMEKNNK